MGSLAFDLTDYSSLGMALFLDEALIEDLTDLLGD